MTLAAIPFEKIWFPAAIKSLLDAKKQPIFVRKPSGDSYSSIHSNKINKCNRRASQNKLAITVCCISIGCGKFRFCLKIGKSSRMKVGG